MYLFDSKNKKNTIIKSYTLKDNIIQRSVKNGYIDNPILLESLLEENVKKWNNLFVKEIIVYLDIINTCNKILFTQILNRLGYKNVKFKSIVKLIKNQINRPLLLLQSTYMIIIDNKKRLILYESFNKISRVKEINAIIKQYLKITPKKCFILGEYKNIYHIIKKNDLHLMYNRDFKCYIINIIKDNL